MQSSNSNARAVGHVLAFLIAVASLIGGIAGLISSLPITMGATLLVIGLVLPVLAWRSLSYSRAAWAFTIAVLAVFDVVTFFGAPKIGHVLGIPLAAAAVFPLIMSAAVVALSQVRADYRTSM
jgi:hypothetical protein